MSNIDKQVLEKAAEKALQGKWDYEAGAIWNTDESGMVQHMAAVEAGDDISDEEHKSNMRFITLATPAVVLGLLDELSESKAAEANESSCANSVIDSAIKWQTRAKDAEAKLEAAEKRNAELNSTLERWAVDRAQSASELEAKDKEISKLRSVIQASRKYVDVLENQLNGRGDND